MAYIKNTWVDQDVERPKTYEVTNNQDGSITLTDSFGLVTELGTPVNETNMNHIEDGIDGCAIRKHNLTETFNLGEWVKGGSGDDEGLYKSLIANNVGNAITDTTKWEKINLGGNTRNLGEIITSTIPLVDAGLHLLDGTLLDGDGVYADFVSYMKDLYENDTQYANIEKVGSLTENNGVLSNFTTSNYGKFYLNFRPASNPWEMVFKVTTGSDFTTPNELVSFQRGSTNETRYGTRIGVVNGGKFGISVTYNGTAWDIVSGTTTGALGTHNVLTDTTYYLKFEFTGTAYKLSYSLDGGETYTVDCNVASTTAMYNNCGYCVLGLWNNGSTLEPWTGSVDLNESYININGERWWTGARPNYFVDEAQWQATYSAYGASGQFVYDPINNTLRLPKVVGFIEGTDNKETLGNLIKAGLPNITGTMGAVRGAEPAANATANQSGAFSGTNQYNNQLQAYSAGNVDSTPRYTFNASLSNSIYGNSTTVQPQAIKVLYYIVVATSTKTAIQVDIDEIATDLNGKADVDLTNVNNTGKIFIAHSAMPSDTYIDLTLGATGSTYTAPADGYFSLGKQSSAAGQGASIFVRTPDLSNSLYGVEYHSATSDQNMKYVWAVKKGSITGISHNLGGITNWFRFIYANGSESEAS